MNIHSFFKHATNEEKTRPTYLKNTNIVPILLTKWKIIIFFIARTNLIHFSVSNPLTASTIDKTVDAADKKTVADDNHFFVIGILNYVD